jgi:alpha-N-arabinofuranosidase
MFLPMSIKKMLVKLSTCIFLLFFGCTLTAIADAQNNTFSFTNPVIRGGFPDPSICRDGEDFYVVNSSFEYFPGLPIHQSKDLVNWQLIGHGLHRPDQLNGVVNLMDVQSDGGIHAPSLRCVNGKFYVITTNVYSPPGDNGKTEFINFVITADDINGPWSEPHVLEGAPGIDPDIFFDDDDRVWYVGTHSPEKPNFPGEGEIWLQEIDTKHWRLKGERHLLWRGACGGVWAEGPHLYKHDGRYYLMVAEGGTSFNHAVMIAVSDNIVGPYLSNPRNPILTSRHLSYDYWVNSTGHADLVELEDGRWYMVALGIRGDYQRRSNMGRETHLLPVTWEREPFEWQEIKYLWPVAAPSTGRVELFNPLPFKNSPQKLESEFSDEFGSPNLNVQWNFRRLPQEGSFSLTVRPGYMRLYAKPEVIAERQRASLTGFRQTESDFTFSARMLFDPTDEGSEAGISLFQKDDNYINFTISKNAGQALLQVTLAVPGKAPEVVWKTPLTEYAGSMQFRVDSGRGSYRFSYSLDGGKSFLETPEVSAGLILSTGYTGANLGLYSTGNGKLTEDFADFDWVNYKGVPRD